MKRKYYISIDQNSWYCGDGCCSDHWVDIYLFENNKEIGRIEQIRHFGYKDDSEEELKQYALEYFELEEEEIEWDF